MNIDGIINKIKKDLKESLEKYIGTDISESKESLKKEIMQYFKQYYKDPEFEIKVEQDKDDDGMLNVEIKEKQ